MKKKNSIIMALMTMAVTTAGAQDKKTIELPAWLNNVKLSGYGMTQYQYSGQKGKKSNSFNIRMGRIALEGRIAVTFDNAISSQLRYSVISPMVSRNIGERICSSESRAGSAYY